MMSVMFFFSHCYRVVSNMLPPSCMSIKWIKKLNYDINYKHNIELTHFGQCHDNAVKVEFMPELS